MPPWEDPEHWVAELRGFLGKQADDVSDDDLLFINNIAMQTVRGEITFVEGMAEIMRWRQSQMGISGVVDDEAFRLELQVNFPDYVDVTVAVKNFLIYTADEPGIADGLIEVWAHPEFTEFVEATSGIAIKHKRWFTIEEMNEHEHAALGWAIAQAVAGGN